MRIGSSSRQDHWVERSQSAQPGPGKYTDQSTGIGRVVQGGYMGSKQKASFANSNPGPGQYESNETITKMSVKQVAINHASRQELWAEQKGAQMPGPGNYADQKSTFGQTHNAPTMGARIEEKVNMNPGPGQYNADASKIRSDVAGSVRIGQAERQDHWVEHNRTELPGPGNYTDVTKDFGHSVKGGHMGQKQKTLVNSNPGPG